MAAESSSFKSLTASPRISTSKNGGSEEPQTVPVLNGDLYGGDGEAEISDEDAALERRLRLKVDLRLCTIAGILCSLNLLDSGVISSASVTSMLSDLDLSGNRYSVAIFIFTIASIVFQLPATVAVRLIGPRVWFAMITVGFGVITM
jgi:hypothetical protein